MESASSLVKYMLIAANLLVALGGLILLVIGVLVRLTMGDVTKHLPASLTATPLLFILLGTCIFILAFIGICGACMESYGLMMTYGVLLTICIVIQVVIIITTFVIIHKLDKSDKKVIEVFDLLFKTGEIFHVLEKNLYCCGTLDYNSYNHNKSNIPFKLPDSCCSRYAIDHKTVFSNNNTCNSVKEKVNPEGCISAVIGYMKKNGLNLAGLAIGITIGEGIAAVFAYSIAKTIRNNEY